MRISWRPLPQEGPQKPAREPAQGHSREQAAGEGGGGEQGEEGQARRGEGGRGRGLWSRLLAGVRVRRVIGDGSQSIFAPGDTADFIWIVRFGFGLLSGSRF